MTSKLTREELLNIIETDHVQCGEASALARMALAALDSEPVAEVVSIYGDPEAFGEREIRPLVGIQQMPYGTKLYRHAQPAQTGVDDDVRNIIGLLENNEWAEHCTETVLGSRLEAEITRLVGSAQPAPVVPDENVSFHRLPGESEYDRLNRQREWMESKSKLAKVTAAAPDDLTERLLRLRAQATLDGSYLDTEEWDSLACDVIKALNDCRAAMLSGGKP